MLTRKQYYADYAGYHKENMRHYGNLVEEKRQEQTHGI